MQKYNLIGIDPSIISTGMVINGNVFNYCRESEVFLKNKKYTKWFDLCKEHISYRYITNTKFKEYSEGEIQKLLQYNNTISLLINDIKDNLIENLPIKIAIEGYSYSSAAGDLIDLVTFSTILRNALLTLTHDIIILAPMSLKLESCKLTYPAKNIGKKKEKLEYRNHIGLAGGNFSKIDMYKSIIENEKFNDKYCTFLKSIKELIGEINIKKPLEDCNDAYLLYLYLNEK